MTIRRCHTAVTKGINNNIFALQLEAQILKDNWKAVTIGMQKLTAIALAVVLQMK